MTDNEPPHRDSGVSDPNLGNTAPSDSSAPRNPAKSRISHLIDLAAILVIVGVLIALLMPAIESPGRPRRRARCTNNLKMIALALNNYYSAHKAFPPAYTTDADGKPLHSWRTLILPQLDYPDLFKSIDLTKPWNDPANAHAFKQGVDVNRCPSFDSNQENETTYLAVVTPDSCMRAAESRSISKESDAPQLTLLVIEVDADHAVPWMQPVDADEDLILQLNKNSRLNHPGGIVAAFADCSARFLPADLPTNQRRALITITADDNAVIKLKD